MRLDQLINLGPAAAIILATAGITTIEQLHSLGSIEAYQRIRKTGFKASINFLYALEGALRNIKWDKLPHNVKRNLRMSIESKASVIITDN